MTVCDGRCSGSLQLPAWPGKAGRAATVGDGVVWGQVGKGTQTC